MGVTISTKHSSDADMGYGSFYRLRNKIAEFVPSEPSNGTVLFLEQPDCGGKLNYKQCKELLSDILDMPDDGEKFGYVHCPITISDFKDMLKSAIEHRCNLYWS